MGITIVISRYSAFIGSLTFLQTIPGSLTPTKFLSPWFPWLSTSVGTLPYPPPLSPLSVLPTHLSQLPITHFLVLSPPPQTGCIYSSPTTIFTNFSLSLPSCWSAQPTLFLCPPCCFIFPALSHSVLPYSPLPCSSLILPFPTPSLSFILPLLFPPFYHRHFQYTTSALYPRTCVSPALSSWLHSFLSLAASTFACASFPHFAVPYFAFHMSSTQ